MAKSFQKDTNGTLLTGLVSYYRLSDTTDFYGSNNLTNNGGATFGAGKYNNAVDLGSSNSSKYLSSTSNFGINGGPCSISLWVNFYSLPASNKGAAVTSVADSTSSVGNMIQLYNNSGTMQVYGFRDKVGVGSQSSGGNFTINTGTWYNFIYTYDGTNIKVFGNGSQIGTSTAASGTGTGGSNLLDIGRNYFGTTEFSSMKIDELGIWSKALSTTEISDLYNSGNGQTMNPPIEFDNATITNSGGSASSLSFNHTIGANGTNRIVFVSTTVDSSRTVSGVTYDGVAMTAIDSQAVSVTNGSLWYLLNPPTGTKQVVISASGSCYIYGGASSYTGVKQSGQPDNKAKTSTTSGTSLDNSLTTAVDNCWTINGLGNAGSNIAAGTGETSRGSSNGQFMIADSAGPISPTQSYTMTTTYTAAGTQLTSIMASFAPYVASTTNIKSINGTLYAQIKSINGTAIASMKSINSLT